MCKMVDIAIKRGQVQLWTWRSIGARIDCPNHFFKGVIVAKSHVADGMIIIVQNDPPWWSEWNRYTSLWYAHRGPCGILCDPHDKDVSEVVQRYHDQFEAQVMNAMAL
jgi:hypothetical protein